MTDNSKEKHGDDGRVVTNMNVDGMPWHMSGSDTDEDKGDSGHQRRPEPLSRRETVQIMLASMKWALLVALAFSALLILFTLFCTLVWFK